MKISFSSYDTDGAYGPKHDYVVIAHLWEDFPKDCYCARGGNEMEALNDLGQRILKIK